jgi:drug/metabolite transporter (DMT)-like permease
MSPTFRAHLALFLANLIYGINYTIAKEVMGVHIEPFGFILLRVSVTVLLIWGTAQLIKKEKIERGDFKLLLLCGLTGVGINQLLFFWGLSLTSPINSSIIMVTTPLLVLIIASVLVGNSFTTTKTLGVLIGLTGAIALLLVKPSDKNISGDLFGDLLTFINAMSYGVYLVLVKPLLQKYHPITVMKWVFLFGLIPVLPAGFSQLAAVQWTAFSPAIWASVGFVVIGTTYLAYLLNTFGLISLSPSVVSAYIYLQPALAGIFAILMGKDQMDWIKLSSTAMIFLGVYLVNRKP